MVNLYGQDLIGRVDVSYNSVWDPEWEEYVEARTDRKVYFVKDHLGSIRQSFGVTGNLVSGYDYYAYGQIKNSITVGTPNDKYKFTRKERDSETGYDYFGARLYDSELGLWLSVDPLEFNNPGISPYSYCSGDPVNRVDLDGMDDDPVHQGKTLPPVDVLSRRWWKEMSDKYLTFSAGESKALTGLAVVATVEPTPIGEAVWGFVAGGILAYKAYELYATSNGDDKYDKEDAYQEKYGKSGFQKMKNGNNKQKNDQFAEALKIMGIKEGTEKARELHNLITKQGLKSPQEIVQYAIDHGFRWTRSR